MRRGTPRDALNRLRWAEPNPDWAQVEIRIRHRGAPGDVKRIRGDRITRLGQTFFEVDGETSIPYHRVLAIRHAGKSVYERPASSKRD